jgi:hypothetical protein
MQSMKTLDWRGISGQRYSARAIIEIRRSHSQLVGECNSDLCANHADVPRLHCQPGRLQHLSVITYCGDLNVNCCEIAITLIDPVARVLSETPVLNTYGRIGGTRLASEWAANGIDTVMNVPLPLD